LFRQASPRVGGGRGASDRPRHRHTAHHNAGGRANGVNPRRMIDRPQTASPAATTPTAQSMINARVSLRPDPARTVSSANTSPSLAGRPSSPVRLRGRPSLLMTDRLPEPRRPSRDEFATPAASYAVEVSP